MKKKIVKGIFIILLFIGFVISISNFMIKKAEARVSWTELWEWPDGTYDCCGGGTGCAIVTPF